MTDQQSILVAVDPPTPLPDLSPVLALALGVDWRIDLVHVVPADGQAEPGRTTPIEEEILHGIRDRPMQSEIDAARSRVAVAEADTHTLRPELDAAKTALNAEAEALAKSMATVEAHVFTGPPVAVVLAAAEKLNSTMIIVVGHRRQAEGRTLMGSFTSALLKVTDRPVMVLPHGSAGSQPGFVAAVDRLIELIDRENQAEELAELRDAAADQLREPESEQKSKHLGTRLTDALHRLETEHPTLTKAINDVSYHLSGMGI